jgi:hypothetical protein
MRMTHSVPSDRWERERGMDTRIVSDKGEEE